MNRFRLPFKHELVDAGYRYGHLFFPPIVNSPLMLAHLLEEASKTLEEVDVPSSPADETREFCESMSDVMDLAATKNCDAVVNCTGLGSRQLCQDNEMLGARGILLNFERTELGRREASGDEANSKDIAIMAESGPWASETMPCYMIPRGSRIVVGGSYLEEDGCQTITQEERAQLFRNAFHLGIDLDKSRPVQQWVGFRPYRPMVRCQVDPNYIGSSIKLIHNYGHGGSGWTVNVGAAKECASLVQEALQE